VTEQSRPGARLEQAFELLLQSPLATQADAERLLAAHPALQDLLAPMLGRAEAPVDDDARSLGEFRLVRELGRGGMGVVYEGWQRSLGRRVAVKVLAPGLADHPAAVARFRREAAAAARLRHPHIVEVHDFGTAAGQHYFAMQYVDGLPLHDCMERFRAPAAAVGLVAQIADALAHAHEHGLIHRDVKPANVLVRADGDAMLADFGIARDEALPSLTQDGGFLGTLDYASPEQVRGERVDARTDVWSVGVLLYRLVAGQHPFPGTTRASLMHQILVTEPASLRGRPGVSDDLAAVIDQALRKERHLRYDSAGALLRDLRALQQGTPVTARLPGTGEKLVRWLRREPWQATAVGALVAGLAASAIGFWQAAERAAAEQVARQQADDALANYDQLAGVVLYDRAIAAESALYPAWPGALAGLRDWRERHLAPLDRLRAQIAATLTDLRATARPRTDDEVAADRSSHPELPALRAAERDLAWLRQGAAAAAAAAAGAPTGPPPDLPATLRNAEAGALNATAWARVAPQAKDRLRDDEAALGLALATAAAARAAGGPTAAETLDTLAWAALANGRDADARAASDRARMVAPPDKVEDFAAYARLVAAAIDERPARVAAAARTVDELAARVAAAGKPRFAAPATQFLVEALTDLAGKLGGPLQSRARSVERRIAFASRVHDATFAHRQAPVSWADARAAIAANPRYQGVALTDDDVLGLVPIGANPVTGLWEFYDLASAWDGAADPAALPIPRHGRDGRIDVTEATGMVFVLLPGGVATIGSQAADPQGAHHDPETQSFTGPVQQVTLAPFFLARHEMTRAQWARLCIDDDQEREPSGYADGFVDTTGHRVDGRHPVERVNWLMADRLLRQHGMTFPTEAQWEHACRAGAGTPWWSGATNASLLDVANVYDAAAARRSPLQQAHEAFDDGHDLHAPVGSFRPNAFGMHDMHGNVGEWCLDAPAPNGLGFRPGDGARPATEHMGDRAARGGSFQQTAWSCRCSTWVFGAVEERAIDLGLRAARRLPPR
jgi:formylglycine-generating enzyme required for sulfatase activity